MTDTKTKILDVAERLTQTNGFNGFSYLDLAAEIGIKTSSIHYHFKTKADLALAVVERAHAAHLQAFTVMNAEIPKPEDRLTALVGEFAGYIGEQKFCVCGMLSAELQSISPAVRSSLRRYFDDIRTWIAKQLDLMGKSDPEKRARDLVCSIEGSLLLARLYDDPDLVWRAMEQVNSP